MSDNHATVSDLIRWLQQIPDPDLVKVMYVSVERGQFQSETKINPLARSAIRWSPSNDLTAGMSISKSHLLLGENW